MDTSRAQDKLLRWSLISLPIAWGILQFYQLALARPIALWALSSFPSLFEHIQPAYPFAVSMFHLALWFALAAIWPHIGFGYARKPARYQGMVALFLIAACGILPIFRMFSGLGSTFSQMGFVTWTITPIQEEILFRGFLYALLLRIFRQSPESSWKKAFPVLVLGALWFSLWHLSPLAIKNYGWQIVGTQVVITFFAGLMFNGLRHWTGSIWLGIPVHAAGNFMVSVM
jgi:membrane protease YdiL (CAAX protease family)